MSDRPVLDSGIKYGFVPDSALDSNFQVQAWSTGLFNCFDDFEICCITCCCPCITFGQIADIIDKGKTPCGTAMAMYMLISMLTSCQWIYSHMFRSRFRMEHGLRADPCDDRLVHFFCECCALCQISRELKNRGWDLDIGYQMNMERREGVQLQVPPAPMEEMMR